MDDPSRLPDRKDSGAGAALQYAGLGFQFAASVILGYWGGGWAGRRWGWSWAETAGLVLGFVVGFWMLVKAALDWERREKK